MPDTAWIRADIWNRLFRSDPYSFSVTLYNLNYGVDDDNVGNADGEMAVNGGEMAEEVRKKFGTITFWIQTIHRR